MSVFLFLIVALTRSMTIVPGDLQNLSPFQSTHSRGVRHNGFYNLEITKLFQSTHSQGVRQ